MRNLITVPSNLRLNNLQKGAEDTVDMLVSFEIVNTQRTNVFNILSLFKDSMGKTKTTRDRRIEDGKRDNIMQGINLQIRAINIILRLTDDEVLITKLDRLMEIFNAHAKGIAKLNYDAETTAVDNYTTQLRTLDADFLDQAHITQPLALLEAANADFRTVSRESITSMTEEEKTVAASQLAEQLRLALNELYTVLFAQVTINPTTELETVYDELSNMVDLL